MAAEEPKDAEEIPGAAAKLSDAKPQEDDDDDTAVVARFPPEQEKELVAEANIAKVEANELFGSGKYEAALAKYDEAVAMCPNYLDYEVAVLKSNVSACYLKLEEWKDAIAAATASIDRLEKVERADADEAGREKAAVAAAAGAEQEAEEEEDKEEEVEEEIISSGAARAGPAAATTTKPRETAAHVARRKRAEDVQRIRAKALLRRARARSEAGGWSNLAGAEEDYKALQKMPNLGPADRRLVQTQLRLLPPRVKAAQEKETAEMWGKLKELGNGILKPFGLSTDNFKMEQDPKTGGYSMNFQQSGGGSR